MAQKKVVVTGMGIVSPVGNSVEESWQNIKRGISGIGKITLFDAEKNPVKIAGEVKNFSAEEFGIDRKSARKMARFTKLLLAAAVQAAADSGYTKENLQKEKTAVCIGNCLGGMDAVDDSYRKFLNPTFAHSRVPALTVPLYIPNEAAANLGIFFGLHGRCFAVDTACSSGTDAIGMGADLIRSGRAEICIAGGTESAVTDFVIASLAQLQALTLSGNENPETACRPFDRTRDGFVFSEGASVLILEDEEHAKKRGAKIHAEISGYGSSCDAHHITSPLEDGSGCRLAVEEALHDAKIDCTQVDYYNAHGTSTVPNDSAETKMIKSVFGDYAKKISISSTKSMTGHMIGAAGSAEAIFCIKAIQDGFVPPTINLKNPDTENGCDLDYTANVGVAKKIRIAASASLGFGGHNSCLIFKAHE